MSGIHITLPVRTVSEANQRGHWAKHKKRRSQHREVARLSLLARIRPTTADVPFPLVVTMTRVAPRELDGDNLQSALKATRDGVADALGIDDRDPRVTWRYGQERGGAREYAVRITVEET